MGDFKVNLSFTVSSDSLSNAYDAAEWFYQTGSENCFHRNKRNAKDIKQINIEVLSKDGTNMVEYIERCDQYGE